MRNRAILKAKNRRGVLPGGGVGGIITTETARRTVRRRRVALFLAFIGRFLVLKSTPFSFSFLTE
ncbi:MAG: hypothetical protein IJX36_03605, partial [Thermoguttaceae bacterium]|nr:hypothetical protein [Thermoguttaceae bacterium]